MFGGLIVGGTMSEVGQVVCFLGEGIDPKTPAERTCIIIIETGKGFLLKGPEMLKCCQNKAVIFKKASPGSDMEKFISKNKDNIIQLIQESKKTQ